MAYKDEDDVVLGILLSNGGDRWAESLQLSVVRVAVGSAHLGRLHRERTFEPKLKRWVGFCPKEDGGVGMMQKL